MLRYPNISPVIIDIYGPIKIRWYSLSYIVGFIYAAWFLKKNIKDSSFKSIKEIDDFATYALIGLILGARIFYVLFYGLQNFAKNPIEIFYVWEGGLSFHGGLIGVLLSAIIFSSVKRINIIKSIDLISVSAPFGLFFGRISNFINGELYGRVSNCSVCMIFPSDPLQMPRHPSQLYEALFEGLALFIAMNILFKIDKVKKISGLLSGIFGMLYAIIRIFIECFRAPDEQLGFIFKHCTMGQVLSFIMLFFTAYWIYRCIKNFYYVKRS